jgi:hypothetical protein
MRNKSLLLRGLAVLAAAAALSSINATQSPPKRWYKGNLHTHTLNSDGDSTPAEVAAWYKEHGYDFLVLSDHNVLSDPKPLNDQFGEGGKFLLLPGEEVTSRFQSRPAHINAYGLRRLVEPLVGDSMAATLQKNIDAIREAGGLPSVNHPNFKWAMASADLLGLKNLKLFEVYNGHPQVHNRGGGGAESLETMWDTLLTAGQKIYGVAVDDAHAFKRIGKELSNPGRGWVQVHAASLSDRDILAGLDEGHFYSSTGVVLDELQAGTNGLRLTVRAAGDNRYSTEFFGAKGRRLAVRHGLKAAYDFQGGEKYVRAVVHSSNGDDAWTQPVFQK